MAIMDQHIVRADAVRIQGREVERFKLLRGGSPQDYFPPAARAEGLDGLVTVDLLLNEAGQVLEAAVLHESPAGKGFGLAALDVAKTYEFANPLGRLVLLSLTIEFVP
jgi:TonB family protein